MNYLNEENYNKLLDVEECIRFYPPDIMELLESDSIFRIKDDREKKLALYFHIPFCKSPCGFCPFNQYNYSEEQLNLYLYSLSKEIQLIKQKIDFSKVQISSIWIGGGTPLDLSVEQLSVILHKINAEFNTCNLLEFTIEGKPVEGMITAEKLKLLKDNRVNRISLGIQSTNDRLLKILVRNYTFEQAQKVISLIHSYGFNLNVDMIYRIPGESEKEMLEDAKKISALKIEHISWFHYISHPGTPLTERLKRDGVKLDHDHDVFFLQYKSIKDIMLSVGYKQYTPYYYTLNQKCQYHLDRWKMPQLDVVGLGAGAFSTYNGWIYTNYHNLELYNDTIGKLKLPIGMGKKMTHEDRVTRLLVLGCKFFKINISEFERVSHENFTKLFSSKLNLLTKMGLLSKEGDELLCTEYGEAFNNAIAMCLSEDKYYAYGQPQPLSIRKKGL